MPGALREPTLPATTTSAGIVELAADGESSDNPLQSDDSRLPTSGQKAALAGTSGTPGAGNPYVTNSDTRLGTGGSPTLAISTLAGSGGMGNVTFDGSTAVPGFAITTNGTTATYTANAGYRYEFNVITLDLRTYTTMVIIPAGNSFQYRRIVELGAGNAYIRWNGSAASGSAAGAGAAQANSGCPLLGGGNGANGRTTANTGLSAGALSVGVALGADNSSRQGGKGGGNNAGIGGGLTRNWNVGNAQYGGTSLFSSLGLFIDYVNNLIYRASGGAGGGGGSVSVGNATSGGGGGGAGVIYIAGASIELTNVTLTIQANGGRGGNATAASNVAGGGQGGGAGAIFFLAASITGAVTLEAIGGDGGNGAAATLIGEGGDGGNGGNVFCWYSVGAAPSTNVSGGTGGTSAGGSGDVLAGATGAALVVQL